MYFAMNYESKLLIGFLGTWNPKLASFSQSKVVISSNMDILVSSRALKQQDFIQGFPLSSVGLTMFQTIIKLSNDDV